MITMKDIAEKAGVSQSTVSRVLSGNSSVSPEKRQIVMEWVRLLEYRPSYSAQILASKKSYLIGLILPDLGNPFFIEITRQVERLASRQGYNLILCNSEGDQRKERNSFQSIRARHVDGILIVPSRSDSTILTTILNASIPAVVLTQEHPDFDSVSIDHGYGGRLVAQHLLSLGHQGILFVGQRGELKISGFLQFYSEKGIALPEIHYLEVDSWDQKRAHRSYEYALEFFNRPESKDVTAVYAGNDLSAFGVMHALNELKIAVPSQVAVVGFDNTFLAQEAWPTLTSVAQPTEEIGRTAIEMLLDRLVNNDKRAVQHVRLEPRLVVRKSSGGY